jgi:hypothetical protein
MPKLNNTNTISGSGMAVLGGIILLIAPWFTPIGFFSKVTLSIIGIILIAIGVKN